ncbi:hypothetical protein FOCG_13189 [Fusarium oxysporum f. sp. radicis-lycopersici 26381]|nr:hypothetical protein FOCG_13189 [Fusarium oxysporum f. sp. radicis-lycopersici 26381]
MSPCHLHPPTQSLPLPFSQRRAKRLNPDANETTPKLPKTPRQPLQALEQNSIVLPNAGSNSQSDNSVLSRPRPRRSAAAIARDQLATLYARYPELGANAPEVEEEEDDDLDEIEIDSGHPPGVEGNFGHEARMPK